MVPQFSAVRSHPLYFVFWFPVFVASLLGSVGAIYGFYWMATAEVPDGMSGMVHGYVQAMYLAMIPAIPVLITLGICLPRKRACRPWVVALTMLLTAGVPAAIKMWPKKADIAYIVAISIVDEDGKPLPHCEVEYKLETPELQHRGRPITLHVTEGDINITKKRGETLFAQVRTQDFCILDVEIGQWFYDVPDYIHQVRLSWRHDNSGTTNAENSCHTAVNWRPVSQGPLRLILLRRAGPPQSPYPPYTEETYRELEANRSR